MHTTPSLARVLKKVGLMGAVLAPITAQADLVDDSHLKVDMRNFYLHRDFTNSDAPCLLYTSPSPRDVEESRMPSSA